MKKYTTYLNALIFGFIVTTNVSASQELGLEKKEYTFWITISEKDNPIKTRSNSLSDKADKFSCGILKLLWPEKADEKLWRIEEVKHAKTGDLKKYIGPMTISNFSKTVTTNPHYDQHLAGSFNFPHALSDATVKKLVKENILKYEVETGTAVHIILENDQESLQKLGLITAQTPMQTLNRTQDQAEIKPQDQPEIKHEDQGKMKTKDKVDNSVKSNTKPRNFFIPYIFVGSIAGLSLISYLLKTLS